MRKLIFLIGLAAFFAALAGTACQKRPYLHGQVYYENYCANCHMEDGSGLQALIPPLAQSDWLAKNQDQLACVIRHGQKDTIIVNGVTYQQPMPGNNELTDIEIANVINYINHAWGNNNGYVSPAKVKGQLKACDDGKLYPEN